MTSEPDRATFADIVATPDDGRRYEIIDGVMVVSDSPGWTHQAVLGEILGTLGTQGRDDPDLIVQLGPVNVILDDGDVVAPDLLVVRRDRLDRVIDGNFHGAPDLIVEVLAPGARDHDLVTKRDRYARAGVPEYWIADPIDRTNGQLRLDDGQYFPVDPDPAGTITSLAFPELALDPVAVFDAAWRTSPGASSTPR